MCKQILNLKPGSKPEKQIRIYMLRKKITVSSNLKIQTIASAKEVWGKDMP